MLRQNRRIARIHQHETACSVGVFDIACRKTRLAEKSRLLVARHAGNRNGYAEKGQFRFTVDAA